MQDKKKGSLINYASTRFPIGILEGYGVGVKG